MEESSEAEEPPSEPPGSETNDASASLRRIPRGSSRRSASTPLSDNAKSFKKKHFPSVSLALWNDWHWQVQHRFRSWNGLRRIMHLTDAEQAALQIPSGRFPVAVTPYYASLLDSENGQDPLRRSVLPLSEEWVRHPEESTDPLGEDKDSPVPGLVHRYPDRVLFLVTGFCSTYCRYCTRSWLVGRHGSGGHASRRLWERALAYIQATPAVRDVLISGGDPLTLADDALGWLLDRLRAIRHVEVLRIGTKVPAVLPQRITRDLVWLLRRDHPLWMSLHFTHPKELTPETAEACARLADAGIPLGSQTVLLKGINDDVTTLRALFQGLLRLRVRPYYLYQCDPINGSPHFRTTIARGLEIMDGLRGHTSGYAVPSYVVDAPGGGGKIPLLPDYVQGVDGEDLILRNYEHRLFRYPKAFEVVSGPGRVVHKAF
ncbi:L-lysine 2,3-aminomutase [Desulfosoma caldarium]|uniref:L-lysine 2,3-aminomutase n=2 Tax=Desulfosoma caldarium TaxID=610254 RepID=A0A3N1UTH7_9BACT|nr:L-lysine 2,3-aminomutase [Desulfosoma caldarium]